VVILLSVEEYACPVLPSFKKVGWQVESGRKYSISLGPFPSVSVLSSPSLPSLNKKSQEVSQSVLNKGISQYGTQDGNPSF
jgi:hypothetical protein